MARNWNIKKFREQIRNQFNKPIKLKALEISVKSGLKRDFWVYMAPDAGFEPATK